MSEPAREIETQRPRTLLDLLPPGEVDQVIREGFDAAMPDALAAELRAENERRQAAAAVSTADAPCTAPATLLVLRGKCRRFLCGAHRSRYTGSGRVVPYLGRSQFDEPTDVPAGTFSGEPRRCGDETS